MTSNVAFRLLLFSVLLVQVIAQSYFGATVPPETLPPRWIEKEFRHDVPLKNCVRFGHEQEFQFEWSLSLEPKNIFEVRFTANVQRGFSSLGLTRGHKVQLVSGHPPENLECARSLYDNFSPFDVEGNVYPAYPELPANMVVVNQSHAIHYAMRNLSTNAARALHQGATMTTNITLLWAYMQSSLFRGGCYFAPAQSQFTEMAQFQLVLGSAEYDATNGQCKPFVGKVESRHGGQMLSRALLTGEMQQNTRVIALLLGGDMLLQTGKQEPQFHTAEGSVTAGENLVGVCQSSLTSLRIAWSGFSDKVGGVNTYEVSAGTPNKPSLYLDRVSVGTSSSTVQKVSLTKNSSLMVSVTAYNFAGLSTTVASKVIRVLNGGSPMYGVMYDGTPAQTLFQRREYQQDMNSLSAYWVGWRNEDHSSKDPTTGDFTDNGFEYAVGETNVDLANMLSWTAVTSFKSEITISSGLVLLHGKKYSISVRSKNCAGAYTVQTTPGVTVDNVPPYPGVVRIGNSTRQHQNKIFKSQHIMANWGQFLDTVSGIKKYYWAVSNRRTPPSMITNEGMIMGWVDVGLALSARNGTLHQLPRQHLLSIGDVIYAHVKAVDAAGNFVIANSNGTMIMGF